MIIAFDIHDNPVSGLEWRMWLVSDLHHRTFICASRKIFSTRDELVQEVKTIAVTMKSDVVVYTGEDAHQEVVRSLFTKKETPFRKDIDG